MTRSESAARSEDRVAGKPMIGGGPRLLLFHKQGTSARTLFLRLPHGGVCAFEPLPPLAQLIGSEPPDGAVVPHPAPVVAEAESRLGLEPGGLELDVEGEFSAWVDTPGEAVPVYLVRFTSIDPPHELAKTLGGEFIAITQARGCVPVEMELLQKAYAAIMEG